MIELDGGLKLPISNRAKGFKRPEDINQRRWDMYKEDRWKRAYTHCLYSMPLHFNLPMHSVVPRLARKMLEATDPFNVALRFIGEMVFAGYLKLIRGMDERRVVPTKKFLELKLDLGNAPGSAISMPKLIGEYIPRSPIRGGIASKENKKVLEVSSRMASERFTINKYILAILKEFPPEFKEPGSDYMYARTIECAKKFVDKIFQFPYFADSRSRMYVNTTCGFNPQGADHEKAIIIPVYSEVLTCSGAESLLEVARSYSEIDWSRDEVIEHAKYPKKYEDEWKKADKPYCYLATANLVYLHSLDPDKPLPAFIPLDGRCSGLQHWSALVRSNFITRHLGMEEEEDELDIYEKIAEDWRKTLESEWKFLATRLSAKIPGMTWGYNATVMTSMDWIHKLFGAKRVWNKELEEFEIVGNGLERAVTGSKGADLYKQLNLTLKPLKAAVNWVSACASAISDTGSVEIHWITPDGFECMQRKVQGERRNLKCVLSNGKEFCLEILDFTKEVPNKKKHRSALAPNIIHSLDATHLRMVARRLEELNLPMVFIHDSFSTHCNHRDVLYEIIVEEFITLYDQNYLESLYKYWIDLYGCELDAPKKLGKWLPSKLSGCRRFFV